MQHQRGIHWRARLSVVGLIVAAAALLISTSVVAQVKQSKASSAWNEGALGRDAAALQAEYEKLGDTLRLRPRLMERGPARPISIPKRFLSGASEGCTTLVSVASPNLSFLLLFSKDDSMPARRAWPIPSAAGVAEVTRCGARKPLLEGLGTKLRSRRGVMELILVSSEHPPPPVSELLPRRNPGPSLPSPQVGRRPWLAPLKARIQALTDRNRLEGAKSVRQSGLTANTHGQGSSIVHLSAGCHRLELLAESDPKAPPDLDGRLHALSSDQELSHDEEHRGQVSLSYCLGRPDRVRLGFTGARPNSEITLVHSAWDIPQGLPISWGPVARARLASTVWSDGLHGLEEAPVYSSLGVRGHTRLVFEVDSERCYVAALAPIRGDIQTMGLAARWGASVRESQSHSATAGSSVSFCPQAASHVTIDTEVAGSGLAWILGVWQVPATVAGRQ